MSIYPWQRSQWQILLAERKRGRLPSALLLVGQQGVGKLKFARMVAQAVLCEQSTEFGCGQCRSCRLFNAGHHPDFFAIEAEQKSKAIRVEQIRTLTIALQQTPQYGGYQVVILQPAENMNSAAANALLKTLEEPIGRVLLLLVSHRVGHLPATIVSRCQRMVFNVVDQTAALTWLQSALPTTVDTDATVLLKIAHYAPLYALDLLAANYLTLRDDLLKYLWQIYRRNADPIAKVKVILAYDHRLLLHAFTTIGMDILRLQFSTDAHYIVNADRIKALHQLAPLIQQQHLLALLARLQQVQKLLLDAHGINVQLLWESLLLQWHSGLKREN